MRRFFAVATIVFTVILVISSLTSVAIAQVNPEFKLGFKALADQIPNIVGTPLENEHYGPNGDSLQRTTNGLMVWRKADNWTAFTDGYKTWVNGPNGIQERLNDQRFDWEASEVAATPTPSSVGMIAVTPTPTPTQPPPSPTPTSTPAPKPIVNVRNINTIQGEDLESNTIWVLGALSNDGAIPAYSIKVTAQLISSDGTVVSSANQGFFYLAPGDILGFRIQLYKPMAFSETKVVVDSSASSFASYGKLSVAGTAMQKNTAAYGGDNFQWDSSVTNNSSKTLTACTVYVWFTDEYGNILWAETAFPAGNLAPGDSASFSVRTTRTKYNPKVSGINQVHALAVGIQQP